MILGTSGIFKKSSGYVTGIVLTFLEKIQIQKSTNENCKYRSVYFLTPDLVGLEFCLVRAYTYGVPENLVDLLVSRST